ncbi:MAG: winged helix-turn-helix domain-containing protein, partial [Rhodospirillales bacterium]|nr:winged helix-turn-helix domain-containing protein [Rhodospirillales bacterium]
RLKDARAARRVLAIALVLEGSDRTHAAKACGMDRQTLRDWVHRYNGEGIVGLSNRKPEGRKARLGPEQKAKIAGLVEAGPDPDKDGVVRWRRIDLKNKIEALFGVTMHERTVGKLLAELGYVRLSTRPQHPESDPAAQEAFKKLSPGRSVRAYRRAHTASRLKSGSRTKLASASKAR